MSGTNPADANPDLSNPDYIAYTNAPLLLTQTGVLFGVAAFIVVLRCYVRVVMLRCFGKDDWTMLLAFGFAMATFIVTDFLLALLPVPLVWQLQLNGRTKITLVCILALGLFAGIAAIIKSEKQKTALTDPDPYVHDTFTMWRFIEYDVGIIVASLPSLKPLFKHILNNGTRGTTANSGHQVVNKVRYSIRNKIVDDDEIPLENHAGVGNSCEVSSGIPRTPVDGRSSVESARPVQSNAIFVDTKWHVS
ncbi:unnamed protein product [Alternaria sp. RS040]